MHIPEDTLLALDKYIDAKIQYELASREEGADGYRDSALKEQKEMDKFWEKFLLTNKHHDKSYNFGWKS